MFPGAVKAFGSEAHVLMAQSGLVAFGCTKESKLSAISRRDAERTQGERSSPAPMPDLLRVAAQNIGIRS
jgi:hypothetical protein